MRSGSNYIVLILILASLPTWAQSPTELTPLEKKQLTILSEPATLYKGFLRAGFFVGYGFNDQSFDADRERIFFRNDNLYGTTNNYQFDLTYGITDRIQVAAVIPFVKQEIHGTQVQQVPLLNEEETILVTAKTKGISDIQLLGYYQIFQETTSFPAITGRVLVILPTGDPDQTNNFPESGVGDITVDVGPGLGQMVTTGRLSARKVAYPFLYSIDFEYLYYFEGDRKVNGQNLELASGTSQDVYATLGMHLNDWITLSGELNFRNNPARGQEDEVNVDRNTLALSPLLSFQIQRFRLFQLVRVPLAGKDSPATTGYAMKVLFTF